MIRNPKRLRNVMVSSALLAGVTLGGAGVASAATGSSTTATTPSSSSSSGAPTGTPPSGAADPSTMTHGPNETLLTGTDLSQATAAALAAEPGATVVRAETDSSGDAKYEVHMKKTDGTYVTVELDSSFKETGTASGFGAGPAGGKAPSGTPPKGTPPTGTPQASSNSSAA
jgi:hypothetical protein